MNEDTDSEVPPVTIKKYANRRLYNTATSSYVTLDHLSSMVKEGTDFVVFDAKSGEDITRQILTHIIVEEEGKGQNLLPISFLRHLISFYGDSLQAVVPNYLDYSMKAFARNQDQMRDYMKDQMGDVSPLGQFEDMGKKNAAMFEEAMKMFTPFMPGVGGVTNEGAEKPRKKPGGKNSGADAGSAQMDDLRQLMEQMQQQIDQLSGNKKA